jgi:hypothetical protein
VGAGVFFSGALQHAPHRVLKSRIERLTYVPQFSDDLEMVVRSVFHSLSMTTFEEIRLEEDETKIISFWERHLAPAIWTDMVTAARDEDYDALKTHIRNLLPESGNATKVVLQDWTTTTFPIIPKQRVCQRI